MGTGTSGPTYGMEGILGNWEFFQVLAPGCDFVFSGTFFVVLINTGSQETPSDSVWIVESLDRGDDEMMTFKPLHTISLISGRSDIGALSSIAVLFFLIIQLLLLLESYLDFLLIGQTWFFFSLT